MLRLRLLWIGVKWFQQMQNLSFVKVHGRKGVIFSAELQAHQTRHTAEEESQEVIQHKHQETESSGYGVWDEILKDLFLGLMALKVNFSLLFDIHESYYKLPGIRVRQSINSFIVLSLPTSLLYLEMNASYYVLPLTLK